MKEFVLLITPAEAVKLSEQSGSFLPVGHSAMEIAEYCTRYFNNLYSDCDPDWNYFCMIQAVFEAGRVQGIREERKRRTEGRTSYGV